MAVAVPKLDFHGEWVGPRPTTCATELSTGSVKAILSYWLHERLPTEQGRKPASLILVPATIFAT
jgi:hypothetical protein